MQSDHNSLDPLTGLPYLRSAFPRIERHLNEGHSLGFLYFEVFQLRELREKYGAKADELLACVGEELKRQNGLYFRKGDMVTVDEGTEGYFSLLLFVPPRQKECFNQADLSFVSKRIYQKLFAGVNNKASQMGMDGEVQISFHTGSAMIKPCGDRDVEHLVREAQRESALKSGLDELMRNFVSHFTHELRTPLTCIRGYAETMLDGALENPELCRSWLEIIRSESLRLERLISDLQELSMVETGSSHLLLEPVDLGELASYAAEVLKPKAAQKGMLIEVQVEDGLPKVELDKDRFQQVVLNLIDNAVKYSPEGSCVTLRVRHGRDGWICLEVEDQGDGIPESNQMHIFERFYRMGKGQKLRTGGRGLGLAIAKNIVDCHNGHISVKSSVGQGSTFTVELPLPVSEPE